MRGWLSWFCGILIVVYLTLAVLIVLTPMGDWWDVTVGPGLMAPNLEKFSNICGTDLFGRSVLYKAFYGSAVAFVVAILSALIAVPIGVALGALAGIRGGWVDDVVLWICNVWSSIPTIILLMAIAFGLGKGVVSIGIAVGLTFWIGLARIIRGEIIQLRSSSFYESALATGVSRLRLLMVHLLPNLLHHMILYFTLIAQAAIKYEVVLSFLGLGVQNGTSWGIMISDAKLEIFRSPVVWWQFATATLAVFFLLLSLSYLGDRLRELTDPKLRAGLVGLG